MTDTLELVRKHEPVLLFSKDGEGNSENFFPLAASHYVHECGLRRRKQGWEHPPGQTLLRHLGEVAESQRCYLAYAAGDVGDGDVLMLMDQGLELSRLPGADPRPGRGETPTGSIVAPRLLVSRAEADDLEERLSAWGGVQRQPLDTLLTPRLDPGESRSARRQVEEGMEWLDELEDPAAAAALKAGLGLSPAFDASRGVPDAPAAALAADMAQMEWVTARGFATLPDSIVGRAREKVAPYQAQYLPVYHYHVCEDRGYRVLQYWFLYAFNDWAAHGGHNDHEGDWEVVCVYLDGENDPQWVAASRHVLKPQKAQWETLRAVDGAIWQDTHPVIYVGCGSHASYLERKAYRYWLLHSTYDHAEGNDVSIGPGADRPWGDPIRLDDKPWNARFAGNWGALLKRWLGLPLPGTTGPTGPAQKGKKWTNPARWAGLPGLS